MPPFESPALSLNPSAGRLMICEEIDLIHHKKQAAINNTTTTGPRGGGQIHNILSGCAVALWVPFICTVSLGAKRWRWP